MVVDGKWCVQTMLCNARDVDAVWLPELELGFFRGCVARPLPGGRYCGEHAAQCTMAPEDCDITDHREVCSSSGITLQYKREGDWHGRADVDVAAIRAYELQLLRKRTSGEPNDGTCGRDDRKSVAETFCARKSAGILAAVRPCLQIASVAPMFSSESLTQVLLFVFICPRRFLNWNTLCTTTHVAWLASSESAERVAPHGLESLV